MRSLLTALPQVAPGVNNYSEEDQARDFRAVFYGHSTPEQGQRVLAQIFLMCEGTPIPPQQMEKTHYVAHRNGMRWVSNLINRALAGGRTITIETEEQQQ